MRNVAMLNTKTVALLITVAWIALVGTLVWLSEASVQDRKVNELGDALAGFFAPIAFFWLVAAVWIQSAELKEQRAELALTRDEMTHQREVMNSQVEE
jgi:hypothetical protein